MRCGTAKEGKGDTLKAVEEQDNSCYKCEFATRVVLQLKKVQQLSTG